jgi:5-methylcytosine-specific restriction endonuclease McrA
MAGIEQPAEEWYRTHPDEVAQTVVPFKVFMKRRMQGIATRTIRRTVKPSKVRRARKVTTVKVAKVSVKTERRPKSNRLRRTPSILPVPSKPIRNRRLWPGSQRWLQQEREISRAIRGKMRHRSGQGFVSAKARLAWMRGDPCAYCGAPADTWDHLNPRKRGGNNSDNNMARACHSCNHEKTSRTLLMFLVIRAHRKAAGTWKRLPGLRLNRFNHGM